MRAMKMRFDRLDGAVSDRSATGPDFPAVSLWAELIAGFWWRQYTSGWQPYGFPRTSPPNLGTRPRSGEALADLPPKAPSFIPRVCGFGFHILRRLIGQARRARSRQIAQASGALVWVFGCRATSAA